MKKLKQVNIFPGRFQPFHKGHLKCCEDAYKKNGLPVVIFYIHNEKFDKKKPFDDELIKKEMEIVKRNNKFIQDAIWLRKPFPTLMCRILQEEGYEANLWIAGEDRIESYKKLLKPEKIEELGVKVPELIQSNRYSSATEVREAIKNGDEEKFKELMPEGTDIMFDEYKKQLDKIIKEQNNIMSLLNYINESLEDGKYLDIPALDYYDSQFNMMRPKEPKRERKFRGPDKVIHTLKRSEEDYARDMAYYEKCLEVYKVKKKEHDAKIKEYESMKKKLSEENFNILIDKLLKIIGDKKRRQVFIQKSVATIVEQAKNNVNKKTWKESELMKMVNNVRCALLLDDKTYISEKYNGELAALEKSIYSAVRYIGLNYDVELPNFDKMAESPLFAEELYSRVDSDTNHGKVPRSDNGYDKYIDKKKAEVAKDKEKVKKLREKWSKTQQYENLVKIANMFEDDVEQAIKSSKRAYTRFDELNGKNKKMVELRDKLGKVAYEYLEDYFGDSMKAVTCYGVSLVDILISLEGKGDEDYKVEIIEKNTSSWLSGMRKSCRFKVTASDGEVYTTGKYEDRGFDSYGDSNIDGFSPWD